MSAVLFNNSPAALQTADCSITYHQLLKYWTPFIRSYSLSLNGPWHASFQFEISALLKKKIGKKILKCHIILDLAPNVHVKCL